MDRGGRKENCVQSSTSNYFRFSKLEKNVACKPRRGERRRRKGALCHRIPYRAQSSMPSHWCVEIRIRYCYQQQRLWVTHEDECWVSQKLNFPLKSHSSPVLRPMPAFDFCHESERIFLFSSESYPILIFDLNSIFGTGLGPYVWILFFNKKNSHFQFRYYFSLSTVEPLFNSVA